MTTCEALIFRPAYPDEMGRAKFVDGDRSWNFQESRWFVALTAGAIERIVGVIRYSHSPCSGSDAAAVHFRITAGPGKELDGGKEEFLNAFIGFTGPAFRGFLRHTLELETGHPLERVFERLGFEPDYRELLLEAPWDKAAARVARIHAVFQRRAHSAAVILPVRDCPPEMAIPLLTRHGLMPESAIRAIWNSPDPTRLDRDASACLVLNAETLGVVMCADAGTHLLVKSLVGREDIAGARSQTITALLHHFTRLRADHGYQKLIFRANADAARQTRNIALRSGGAVIREARRWGKRVD